jgi:hypothetical protein
VLIEAGQVRDGLAGVLGRAREDQGLGAVERGAQADLALLGAVGALESSLGSGVGLLSALGGGYMERDISKRSYSELAMTAAA